MIQVLHFRGDVEAVNLLPEAELMQAAGNLEYEKAALLRDQIAELKAGTGISKLEPKRKPVTCGKGKRGRK
jgi:excinuclease ABC subunit B